MISRRNALGTLLLTVAQMLLSSVGRADLPMPPEPTLQEIVMRAPYIVLAEVEKASFVQESYGDTAPRVYYKLLDETKPLVPHTQGVLQLKILKIIKWPEESQTAQLIVLYPLYSDPIDGRGAREVFTDEFKAGRHWIFFLRTDPFGPSDPPEFFGAERIFIPIRGGARRVAPEPPERMHRILEILQTSKKTSGN